MQSEIVGSVQDLASVSNRMIDEGCKDVVVFVGGHGAPAEGPGATAEPTVVLHTKVTPSADGQESVQRARESFGDLVFALTLASDLSAFTESGTDKAAASGRR